MEVRIITNLAIIVALACVFKTGEGQNANTAVKVTEDKQMMSNLLRDPVLSSKVNEFKNLLDEIRIKDTVYLSIVDSSYVEMAINLYLTGYKQLDISNYVFVCTDQLSADILESYNIENFLLVDDPEGKERASGDSDSFWRKIGYRLKVASLALALGYDVIVLDVDIVMFRNPFYQLRSVTVDVATSIDSGYIGLYMARQTEQSRKVHMKALKLMAQNPGSRTDPLRQAIEGEAKKGKLNWQKLEDQMFPGGSEFFEKGKRIFKGDNPCIEFKCVSFLVHNNHIESYQAKVYRFREYGIWNVDIGGYYSNPDEKYIMYEKPQQSTNDADMREKERKSLKAALELGAILGRKVILPRFHCYGCDSKACVATENYCSFSCHFHVQSLQEQLGNAFRENVFLDHPMVPQSVKESISPEIYLEGLDPQPEVGTESIIVDVDEGKLSVDDLISLLDGSDLNRFSVLKFKSLDVDVDIPERYQIPDVDAGLVWSDYGQLITSDAPYKKGRKGRKKKLVPKFVYNAEGEIIGTEMGREDEAEIVLSTSGVDGNYVKLGTKDQFPSLDKENDGKIERSDNNEQGVGGGGVGASSQGVSKEESKPDGNNLKEDKSDNSDNKEGSSSTHKPVPVATDSDAQANKPSSLIEAIKSTVEKDTEGRKTIFITVIDSSQIELALNQHIVNFKRLNLTNYLFVCTDQNSVRLLSHKGIDCFSYESEIPAIIAGRSKLSETFIRHNVKLQVASVVLEAGYQVIASDPDMILFKDPANYLSTLKGDMMFLRDLGRESSLFYVANPSTQALSAHKTTLTLMATQEEPGNHFIDPSADALVVSAKQMAGEGRLKMQSLDEDRFPSAALYFERDGRVFAGDKNCLVDEQCQAFLVLNNRMESRAAKIYRLREAGLWRSDSQSYYSDGETKFILYGNPTDFGTMSTQEERKALKAALTIGAILGRKVILPKFHCYGCDSGACRIATDHCPLNSFLHVQTLTAGLPEALKEHSFLDNPLVPDCVKGSISPPVYLNTSEGNEQVLLQNNDDHFVLRYGEQLGHDDIVYWFDSGPVSRFSILHFDSLYVTVATSDVISEKIENSLYWSNYHQTTRNRG